MIKIYNVKVMPISSENIENGYVITEGEKIKEFGAGNGPVCDEMIDGGGGYLLPGFIDAHCHIGLFEDGMGFEGEDGNESVDPVTPHLRAIDGINHDDRCFVEAREAGVTTVVTGPGSANVLGGQFTALKTYGRYVDEMILKECVALKAALGENPKTVYNDKKQSPMTRMATAAILRESLIKAVKYKEEWDKYNKDVTENDEPEYDIRNEALLKLLRHEVPLKIHAHRADDIMTAIRIAKEFDILYTIEHATEGHLIADVLCEEKANIIIGPMLVDRCKIELKNLSVGAGKILCEAGLEFAIMTDHPCVPIRYLPLCAAIAVKEGMNEMEALKAITINAARLTGIDDRVGSIEIGKDADIVLYSGHPLEFRTNVIHTMINGKIV